ncbi:MAG: ArsR/SmtB family transcription factor [Candidatus Hodarchaeales archaeon]
MEDTESIIFDEPLLKALNHDLRRKILLEIFENGVGGYTELTRALDLKSGVFYHHMRLLEDAGLVQQLGDKSYDITLKGFQAIEFFRNNFIPIQTSKLEQRFAIYNTFSSRIDSFPMSSLIFQLVLIILGVFWLSFFQQRGFIGFFIVPSQETLLLFLLSLFVFSLDVILLYSYFTYIMKRTFEKIHLFNHLLLPYTLLILLVFTFSILPDIPILVSLALFIGMVLTVIIQIFNLTYYTYILQKNRVRSLEKAIIGILIVQYLNLLLIYLLF